MFSTTQSPDPAKKFTIVPQSLFLIILLDNRAIKSLLTTNLPQKVVSLLCLISGRSVTILLTATEFNVNRIILIRRAGFRIRIRIRVKSWIRIRIKIKILGVTSFNGAVEGRSLKMKAWRVCRPVVADSHQLDDEQDPDPDPH